MSLIQSAFVQTVLVAKINEPNMRGKHEEKINNFFLSLNRDHPEQFQQTMSGYCVVYAPYYICFLESEDTEYLDFVLQQIQDEIGGEIHEAVHAIFQTEECPERAFDQFDVRSYNAASS